MPTLNWIGKEAVVDHHRRVPLRLLECDPSLSTGDPEAGNLLVQGDNLEALKALLPRYKGQVKCIYIDPPYNTGNEGWIYNDNVNDPRIKKWLGEVVGKEAEDLCRHDKWLCMMYPRLSLLHEMLKKEGVLFVSIDDVELANLQFVLDEIFGRSNRIGTIVWKNATDNNPTMIVPEHEYVLCYAKDKSELPSEWKATTLDAQRKLLEIGQRFVDEYTDQSERQAAYTKWFRANKAHLWPFEDYKFIDQGGVYTGMRAVHNPGKEGYRYDVPHEKTGRPCQQPLMGYRFPWETMEKLLAEKRILFGEDETKLIELKVYAKDYRAKLSSVFELDGRRGTNEIKAVFPEQKRAFNFPKPTGLVEELLSFVTTNGDLVLDSFTGSGTTGHAVLTLNKSDGGNRNFILIEMDDNIARNVTAVRLKRAIEGYKRAGGRAGANSVPGLGGGFRFCRLGKTLFDSQGEINADVPFADLARYVYLIETGVPIPARPRKDQPLLGVHEGRAIYLLYNGVLGDKRPAGGNVLTHAVLEALPPHPGGPRATRVIYGEACRLSQPTLARLNVVFRQTPYDLREG